MYFAQFIVLLCITNRYKFWIIDRLSTKVNPNKSKYAGFYYYIFRYSAQILTTDAVLLFLTKINVFFFYSVDVGKIVYLNFK